MEVIYPDNLIERLVLEEEKKCGGLFRHSEEAVKRATFVYNILSDVAVDYEEDSIKADVSRASSDVVITAKLSDVFIQNDNMHTFLDVLRCIDKVSIKHGEDYMTVIMKVCNLWEAT